MCRLTPTLIALALMIATGRESQAADPDAAALAALIDRHVEARLKAEQLPLAEPAGDAEFLRRVYLDLLGVIPTADQGRKRDRPRSFFKAGRTIILGCPCE